MKIITVNTSDIRNTYRRIKAVFSRDAHDSYLLTPFGDDSCPTDNAKGIKIETNNNAIDAVIGFFNRSNIAQKGEKRLFSVKANGDEGFYVYFKNDGSFELGGTADNLAGYTKLKEGFDQLRSDFNTFKATHTHLGVTAGTGITGVSSDVTPSTADISACKKDKIKTL